MSFSLTVLRLLPKNHLSQLVGYAVRRKWPFNLHTSIRDAFISAYKVNVDEAELDLAAYSTLGDFFIRKLKPFARQIADSELVCPVDGKATERGLIESQAGTLTQVKGMPYTLKDLLPKDSDSAQFLGGFFVTLYLAPFNYHRIHSPCEATVTRVTQIPGALWPVNTGSVTRIPELFVRNERVILELKTKRGPIAMCLIGATNVGRISVDAIPGHFGNETRTSLSPRNWPLPGGKPYQAGKAEGVACFEMGSTVVLLLGPEWRATLSPWLLTQSSTEVKMGQALNL